VSVALVNLKTAREWVADGRPMAVATPIETEGSSPIEVWALVEEAHQVLAGREVASS